MGHNEHDNERPAEGSIPMPPDRDRMGRKRSRWGRPMNASPLAPDPAHNDDKPPKRRLAAERAVPRIIPGAQIIGTSKFNEEPIYRCLAKIGDSQCDHTSVDPDRMNRHIVGTIHWANKPDEETHRCGYRDQKGQRCLFTGPRPDVVEHLVLVERGGGSHYFEPKVVTNPPEWPEKEACGHRNEQGQQCLVRGTREGVFEHIILVQKGDASHHFMPQPETTSPGVDQDPKPEELTFTERTYKLISQTQRELLRALEYADESNIKDGDRTWRKNRVAELVKKLEALKLIVDSTPPVIIMPNVRNTPLIGSI